MQLPPSTFVTISRATQLDAYGDPVDIDSDPLYVDVPAVLAATVATGQDPATGTPRQVRTLRCILPRGTDVQLDDRIGDQFTGAVYNVTVVSTGTSYGFSADVVTTLSAAGG